MGCCCCLHSTIYKPSNKLQIDKAGYNVLLSDNYVNLTTTRYNMLRKRSNFIYAMYFMVHRVV